MTSSRPGSYLPDALRPLQSWVHRLLPWLVDKSDGLTLGPVPQGVPVNLLANTQFLSEGRDPAKHYAQLVNLAARTKADLLTMPKDATDAQLRTKFANLSGPFLSLNKCPDFVVNRGHLFGTDAFNRTETLSPDEQAWGAETPLSDADKRALIAFVKRF